MPAFEVIVWYSLAGGTVFAALMVIHIRDLFKAALLLAATFLSVVGFFVLLRAEFLAVVQLLIYVGAISILVIFAVMLTRDVHQGNPFNKFRMPALTLASLLLASIIYVVATTTWTKLPDLTNGSPLHLVFSDTTSQLGSILLNDYALAIEIGAVLLVSAIIGAIVLVKER